MVIQTALNDFHATSGCKAANQHTELFTTQINSSALILAPTVY